MLRKTHSVDPDVPVGSERSAHSEEYEHHDGGEEGDACYQCIYPSNDVSGIHDTEEKEADGYLHQGERDEGLDPIGPAQNLEESTLRGGQVVLVSSQPVEDFSRDQSRADQRCNLGGVIEVSQSIPSTSKSTRREE